MKYPKTKCSLCDQVNPHDAARCINPRCLVSMKTYGQQILEEKKDAKV